MISRKSINSNTSILLLLLLLQGVVAAAVGGGNRNSALPQTRTTTTRRRLGSSDASSSAVVEAYSSGVSGSDGSLSESPPLPSVVWLLSFPNSGTSYTLMNTQHITNTTAGTNYANEVSKGYDHVHIRPDVPHSPYYLKPYVRAPDTWVLTKTHCAGYCSTCSELYITLSDFMQGCGSIHTEKDPQHNDHFQVSSYNAPALVKKAVHIFRDPLDNLVSRKHLQIAALQKQRKRMEKEVIVQDSPEGLLAWCRYSDDGLLLRSQSDSDSDSDSGRLSEEMKDWMRSIPCSAELYRYVQWHNLAIQTTQSLGLDVHYLYYENYGTQYRETVTELLDYLELNMTHHGFDWALPFSGNKSYHHLYEHGNFSKTAMSVFLRRYATPETWSHIRRYIHSWYDEENDQSAQVNIER